MRSSPLRTTKQTFKNAHRPPQLRHLLRHVSSLSTFLLTERTVLPRKRDGIIMPENKQDILNNGISPPGFGFI